MSLEEAESHVVKLIEEGKRAGVWRNHIHTEEYGVYYS